MFLVNQFFYIQTATISYILVTHSAQSESRTRLRSSKVLTPIQKNMNKSINLYSAIESMYKILLLTSEVQSNCRNRAVNSMYREYCYQEEEALLIACRGILPVLLEKQSRKQKYCYQRVKQRLRYLFYRSNRRACVKILRVF